MSKEGMRMAIKVEPGYAAVIKRFGKFGRIVGAGTHVLVPGVEKEGDIFKIGQRVFEDTVDTNDDRTIKTVDGIKIGYRYEMHVDITNPEKFYKADFIYPNCTGLKADAEWMIESRMSKMSYMQAIDTFNKESDTGWLSLNDDELRYVQQAANKAAIKVLGIRFKLSFGRDYDYWESFCEFVNSNGRFRKAFGKAVKQFDSNNTMDLPGRDGRYRMRLSRESSKNMISVEISMKKMDTNFQVIKQRQNYIEHELKWNYEWYDSSKDIATAKISIKIPPENMTNKETWEGQYTQLMDLAVQIKTLFSDILDEFGTPDIIESGSSRVEVMSCICSNCGGALDTGTRICPFCGTNQMLVKR